MVLTRKLVAGFHPQNDNSGSNPNYLRSYGLSIEPTTPTGVLGIYQNAKWASASFGIANTFGLSITQKADAGGLNAEFNKTYTGSFTLTAPEEWGPLRVLPSISAASTA